MTAPRRPLGDIIREKRRGFQLSLRELADRTDVSNAYLSQVERGLHQPSIRVLRAIADALEMSSEQMMMYAGLIPGDPAKMEAAEPSHTIAAISTDPRLTPTDRETLLALYLRLIALPPNRQAGYDASQPETG